MSYSDDSNSTDPKQTPNPRPDPTESAGPTGWLDALNSFLERAFLRRMWIPDVDPHEPSGRSARQSRTQDGG